MPLVASYHHADNINNNSNHTIRPSGRMRAAYDSSPAPRVSRFCATCVVDVVESSSPPLSSFVTPFCAARVVDVVESSRRPLLSSANAVNSSMVFIPLGLGTKVPQAFAHCPLAVLHGPAEA